jgi:hypothetical protein
LGNLCGQIAYEHICLRIRLGGDLLGDGDDLSIDCRVVESLLTFFTLFFGQELGVSILAIFLCFFINHDESLVNFMARLLDEFKQVKVIKLFWQVAKMKRGQTVLLYQ